MFGSGIGAYCGPGAGVDRMITLHVLDNSLAVQHGMAVSTFPDLKAATEHIEKSIADKRAVLNQATGGSLGGLKIEGAGIGSGSDLKAIVKNICDAVGLPVEAVRGIIAERLGIDPWKLEKEDDEAAE